MADNVAEIALTLAFFASSAVATFAAMLLATLVVRTKP